MVLSLTAIDQKGQFREFTCQIPNLEAAFDVLSSITTLGDTLTKASILDQGRLIKLPIEAFDGEAFLDPIQDLERQWQAVLRDDPASSASNYTELIQWTRRQVQQYERHISTIGDLIDRFRRLQQRAESCTSNPSAQAGIANHFTAMLNKYEHLRGKTQLLHQAAIERLNRLTASSLSK